MAAIPFIQPSFSAGEISPELWGRVDLAKYRTGASWLRNMYVDYRGGASNRPGSQYIGPCRVFPNAKPPRLLPFRFNDQQTYVIELNHNRMRVMEDGQYVTLAAVNITGITQANPPVVTTSGAHGITANDYFYIDGVVGMERPNGISGVNGRIFRPGNITSNTVQLVDPFGFTVNSTGWTAYSSGGTTAKIMSLATPWNEDILFELKYVQSADVLTVVHKDVVPTNISRTSGGVWAVTAESFGPDIFPPTGVSVSIQNCGPFGSDSYQQYTYRYVVTALNSQTGDESAASDIASGTCKFLDPYAQNRVTVATISWSAVDGADQYRIYKTQPIPTTFPGGGSPYAWGLIGETSGLKYRDLNYEPDYTRTPPTLNNPFSDGIIESASIVDAGFGYDNPVVVVTDPNPAASGAAISAVTDSAGAITGLTVTNGGSRYTAPVLSIEESGFVAGTGATIAFDGTWVGSDPTAHITISAGGTGYHVPRITATINSCSGSGTSTNGDGYGTVTNGVLTGIVWDTPPSRSGDTTACMISFTIVDHPADDGSTPDALATATAMLGDEINPGCVCYYQQRKCYGGGDQPRTFWMTRPGLFNNFDVHYPVQDDDAITGDIVGNDVNAILSFVPMPSGLIAFTSSGAFLLTGGGDNSAVTPSNINANPQVSSGAAALQPILVGSDIIYKQARGTAVRSLAFAFEIDGFTGTDLSALSSHLFIGAELTQWAWAEEPLHLVWGVRDDGVLLSLAYIKDQQVYGWSHHDTQGKYVSVASVPEGGEDAVYVVVRRAINGAYYYVTERFASRRLGGNLALNLPTDPENAWFVDCGARLAMTYPAANLLSNTNVVLGTLNDYEIITGGTGYDDATDVVTVSDPTGTGAVVEITTTAGVITAVTIVDGGTNYTSPQISVSGGSGANIALFPANLQTFSLSASVGSGTEGRVLRVAGGQGVVLSATSTTLTCDMTTPLPVNVPNAPAGTLPPVIAEEGDWSLSEPVSSIGGLDHLTGQYVTGVADGSFVSPRLVVDGCVDLDVAASAVTLGLGYTAQLQTVRWEIDNPTIQAKRKQLPQLAVRSMDTRGITVGPNFTQMYEVKQRSTEIMGHPIAFQTGGGVLSPLFENGPTAPRPLSYADRITPIETTWEREGVVCVQQSYPLPVTVLALIPSIVVGDDPN